MANAAYCLKALLVLPIVLVLMLMDVVPKR